jgi:2-polyprenyl-3-methyl-5-hydroxy-6-metoxy-1,4-benzoquinol methylase
MKPTTEPSTPLKSRDQTVCDCCGEANAVPFLTAPDRYHGRKELYQLVRCPLCSLVWLNNKLRPEQMGEHYGADYDRSVSAAGESPNHWRDRWEMLSQYKTSGAILDLGCSAGGFLTGLRNSYWKLYGIEMSEAVAKKAQARSGAEVFVGDILDAPFPSEQFDAITCFHVLEHLYHPRDVLEKVFEWLKPGGIFYVNVPNIDSAGCRIFKSYWYALELPRHLFHFSPKSLRALIRPVGFEVVFVTTDREVFIEASTRYILDNIFRRMGIDRIPLAKASQPGIPFRVVRKAFRLTGLPALNAVASLAGDGEIIHAIFRKRAGR